MIAKTHLILILLFCNAWAFGQTIRGRVLDSIQSPISYATIAVLNSSDSSLIKGTISDEKGNFTIQLNNKGFYLLKITALGFNTKCCEPLQLDSVIDLSPIVRSSGGIDINEV